MTKEKLACVHYSQQLSWSRMILDIGDKVSLGQNYKQLFNRVRVIKQLSSLFKSEYGKGNNSKLELLQHIVNLINSLIVGYKIVGNVELSEFIVASFPNTHTTLHVGGSLLVVSSIPEEDGLDAFSTGGAYILQKTLSEGIEKSDTFRGKFPTLDSLKEAFFDFNPAPRSGDYAVVEEVDKDVTPYFWDSQNQDWVLVQGGGGGGGGTGIFMRLRTVTDRVTNFIKGEDSLISFNFTSIDLVDQTPTGNGTIRVFSNNEFVYGGPLEQGDTTLNAKDWLIGGANNLVVEVTDSYGTVRTIDYLINFIDLSLTTTYDLTTINDGDIIFRYTPIGTFEKTIHFVLDGVELMPPVVTSLSNAQLTKVIPAQSHGLHKLEVYMTVTLNGTVARSKSLWVDIISVEEGNTTPIIAVDLSQTTVEQYVTIPISYFIYDPVNINASALLKANGITVSSVLVPRTKQIWNYKPTAPGTFNMSIVTGVTTNNFELLVTPTTVDANPVLEDLQLYLSSQNRNNQEINKDDWEFENISSTLSGFNWFNNGWTIDSQGSTMLKVSEGAAVSIPITPFSTETRSSGKTIEFEFSVTDVQDYTTSIIKCLSGGIGFDITATSIKFSSEQIFLETQFKEDERVRLSIVINKLTENRLIYIYINGIISAVVQYPSIDNFIQTIPQTISIGSTQATVNVYNIRVYNNNLNARQLLGNYIYDLDNVDDKLALVDRNNVFNDSNLIDYNKTLEFLPAMVITGRLPDFKGDKVMCDISYTNRQDPSRSFTGRGQVDVQGTSSQYYPRKNFKIKFDNFTNNGVTTSKYPLRPGYINERTFTFKADFAESSGTHNTGFARLVHYLSRQLNILTPPEQADNRVRTTIDGFPMMIFHKTSPSAPAFFVGKYNFNHDKGNEATFGFATGDECWEVLNNTSDNVLFKSSDFTSVDENDRPLWLNDFEARYPEDNMNKTKLQTLHEWISSTNGNVTKFRNEVANHFNMDNLLFYYCMTEFAAAVDQRAKNTMLTYFSATNKWYYIFYDNDTIFGLNNEGAMSFDYTVEYHDTKGSGFVWNAESSVLFNNIESAFPTEIAAMYARIRGEMTYEVLMGFFNVDQSDKWGEAIYNEDARYKYIQPLLEDGQGTYLYAAQGSRKELRKWWLFNRLLYLDGKYNTATFLNDYATMRLYTPSVWTAIAPNADFLLTAFKKGYVRTRYGSTDVRAKVLANDTALIKAPNITFNDTETIVYGMGNIKSLGSLTAKYAGTIDLSKALKLADLQIGSIAPGYRNLNLISLSLGNNKLLQTIDISNCSALTQPLDLSGCSSIKQVKAKGSGISGVTLPTGGVIELLDLPAVSSLSLKGQIFITAENISIESYANLKTVIIENCPLLNVGELIDKFTNVTRIRLVGIQGASDLSLDFYYLNSMQGLDENGNTTPNAIIEGNWHFTNAFQEDLDVFETLYPMLNITYDNLLTEVPFASSAIKTVLENKFGAPLTLSKIRGITDMDECFNGYTIPTADRFDEFRYFTGVTVIREFDTPLASADNAINSITFPKTLERIEERAYVQARVVRNVENIKYLGQGAFGYFTTSRSLSGMDYISFPSLEEIGFDRPYNTRGILTNCGGDNLVLDLSTSKLQTLPGGAINGGFVNTLILPNTLKKLEEWESIGLQGIKVFTPLPNSIEVFERYTYDTRNWGDITGVPQVFKLPINTKTINNNAFSYMNYAGIIEVEIANNIQYIGANAFNSALTRVVMLGLTPPAIDINAFSTSAFTGDIFVPDEAVEIYRVATNWIVYASRIKPMSEKPAL